MYYGNSQQISLTFAPGDGPNCCVGDEVIVMAESADPSFKASKWRSSDTSLATVDQQGKVTCVGVGIVEITLVCDVGTFTNVPLSTTLFIMPTEHRITVEMTRKATCITAGIRTVTCTCGYQTEVNYECSSSELESDPDCHEDLDPTTGRCDACGYKVYTAAPAPAPIPELIPTQAPAPAPTPAPTQSPAPGTVGEQALRFPENFSFVYSRASGGPPFRRSAAGALYGVHQLLR